MTSMTSEEIRKLITEKGISQILLGDRKLTDKELDIWYAGYDDGITDGLKCSIARTKEMFDPTVREKREEIEKRIIENALSQITIGDRKLTEKELDIWHAGYYDGITDGLKCSIANEKGEEK